MSIRSLVIVTEAIQKRGAVGQNRTGDLLLTMELLYRLSYNGNPEHEHGWNRYTLHQLYKKMKGFVNQFLT